LDLKDIKELIALMRKNDLSVFKMERDGFKITLKRGNDYQPIIAAPAPVPQNSIPVAAPVAPAPQSGVAAGDASEPKDNYKEIKSPHGRNVLRCADPRVTAISFRGLHRHGRYSRLHHRGDEGDE
jgi:biotin carboxyl carrier protein